MIQRNGKIFPCSWIGKINIVKMNILPEATYPCNGYPYQITHDIFHRTRTNNLKIYMESQKTQNRQRNPEEKQQSCRHNPPRLQTILQSYSNQNSVVLAQKQTYGSMEQNREPRIKPTPLQSIFDKGGKNITREKKSLQHVVLGKLNSRM